MEFLKRQRYVVLFLLVVIAFVSRFFWLDQAPRGLLIDEAHYGYIAHSLAETGKDEHGVAYPLIFKGFGDQKLPVYAYALVPLVKWFGLNATVVRLPSVLAGSLLVLATYWLMRELEFSQENSLFGSLLVTLSPWTFFLSRIAFESNLALLVFTLGLASLTKAIKHKKLTWMVLSSTLLALTWYTYVAYRPVTLVFSLIMLGYFLWKKQLKPKLVAAYVLSFAILISPLFHPKIIKTGASRFVQVGLLSDPGVVMVINENRNFCTTYLPKVICYGLWNKPIVFGRSLMQNFFHVYSPQFLATKGDDANRYLSVENYGQFYWLMYPFLLLGLVGLLFKVKKTKVSDNLRLMMVLGLLVGPISSILSGDPQKVRLSPVLPFLIIMISLGWSILMRFIKNIKFKTLAGILIVGYLSLSVGIYWLNFFTIHTRKHDLVYQSYLPDLFNKLPLEDDQTEVYIKPFFSDPIMAYAYYEQIDPQFYQENVVLGPLEPSGFQHAVGLGQVHVTDDPFVNVACRAVENNQPTVYTTNEFFLGISYLEKIASETGAVYYAYIYDALAYGQNHPEFCF